MLRNVLISLLMAAIPLATVAQTADAFVPKEYEAALKASHSVGAGEHVLTVRKITSAIENMNTGKITVSSVTQLLDCKTGKLLSQSRCDPCEYNVAEWPQRPRDVWFSEVSWPQGATVARTRARMQMDHFARYFVLERMDGTEHQGFTYQFWRFDGRRGTPLVDRTETETKPVTTIVEPPKPRYGPVEQIEIFEGTARPDEVTASEGGAVTLVAKAYAKLEGSTVLSLVDDFTPLWSTSCATLSDTRQKQVILTLKPDADRCKVFLYEGKTGKEDAITVVRPVKKPSVRVVITFGGGKEADGVVLTGTVRSVEVVARAFDVAGNELPDFEPEWSVENGKVKFPDKKDRRKLKVVVDKGETRAEVRARHAESGAEDIFLVEIRK